jgi:plastocyanin
MMKGSLALAAFALILASVLASCGGGASSSGGSSGGGSPGGGGGNGYGGGNTPSSGGTLKTIVIKETEYKLSPSTVTLSKPGTYAFKADDDGSTQHSLEIEGEGVKSEGGGDEGGEAQLEQALNPGQSGVLMVSFRKPGTYEMYCPVDGHKQMGMKGEVVVR